MALWSEFGWCVDRKTVEGGIYTTHSGVVVFCSCVECSKLPVEADVLKGLVENWNRPRHLIARALTFFFLSFFF